MNRPKFSTIFSRRRNSARALKISGNRYEKQSLASKCVNLRVFSEFQSCISMLSSRGLNTFAIPVEEMCHNYNVTAFETYVIKWAIHDVKFSWPEMLSPNKLKVSSRNLFLTDIGEVKWLIFPKMLRIIVLVCFLIVPFATLSTEDDPDYFPPEFTCSDSGK